ncbi:hypothetical protein CHARACLAT_028592, partial [Characodon lateralis]|nr:hypothetical protein [Characodon lateralis]
EWSAHGPVPANGAAPFPCSPYLHKSSEQRTHLLQRHLKSLLLFYFKTWLRMR